MEKETQVYNNLMGVVRKEQEMVQTEAVAARNFKLVEEVFMEEVIMVFPCVTELGTFQEELLHSAYLNLLRMPVCEISGSLCCNVF